VNIIGKAVFATALGHIPFIESGQLQINVDGLSKFVNQIKKCNGFALSTSIKKRLLELYKRSIQKISEVIIKKKNCYN